MAHQGMFDGMYGPQPWEIEEKRRQAAMAEDMAVAKMTPGQAGVYISGQAGRQLGGGIRGVATGLGLPMPADPAMEQASKIAQINKDLSASGISPADTEKYLTALGEKLAQAGLTKEAMNVGEALQTHRDKQATLDTKKYDSETARIKAEAFRTSKLRSPVAQAIFNKNKEYTPASLQKYLESITDGTPEGNMSLLEPYSESKGWNSDGFTPDKKFVFTNDKGEVAVRDEVTGKLVPYNGPVASSTKGTTVKNDISVGMPKVEYTVVNEAPKGGISEAGSKMISGSGQKALDKHNDAIAAIDDVGPKLEALEAILKKQGPLITGTGGNFRLEAERARVTGLKALGRKPDEEALNNTDTLKQYTQVAVLPLLAKVGGSDTEEEQKNLRAALANNTLTYAMVEKSVAQARKAMNKTLARQKAWQAEIDSGNLNPEKFWATGGNSTTNKTPNNQDITPTKTTTKITGGPNNVRQELANPPLMPPRAAVPVGNPNFENAVSIVMQQQGITREEAIAKLLQAKGQGQ